MTTEEKLLTYGSQRPFEPNQTLKLLQQDINIFWSWGVEKKILVIGKESDGWVKGIIFKVNGFKWKQYVMITLNGLDYYEVRLLSQNFDVIETKDHDICFMDLVEVIDKLVETKEKIVL
jgi:hypothetical protein